MLLDLENIHSDCCCNKSIMDDHYVKDWYSSLHLYSEGKLSTYVKIKQKWGFESYLSVVRNFDYRRSMCKLRISSHSLKIETGRFTNTPRNERLCTKCSSNTIENELHFLITCVKYDYERQEIFKLIDSKYHNFSTLNTEQKLQYIGCSTVKRRKSLILLADLLAKICDTLKIM